MKYHYFYQTRDNESLDDWIIAKDRNDAFRLLRKRGIKPYKLIGKNPIAWKRWATIGVLTLGLIITCSMLLFRGSSNSPTQSELFISPLRRQLIGDSTIIESGIMNGWRDIFSLEGECFLASFAIPGRTPHIKKTSEKEIEKALAITSRPNKKDSIEIVQIKSMVEGMKNELRDYLKAGGTIIQYGNRLVERQEEEIKYFRRLKNQIEASKLPRSELYLLWKNSNNELRNMGIQPIPVPDSLASE